MHSAKVQARRRGGWPALLRFVLAAVLGAFVTGQERPSVADLSQSEGPSSPTKKLDGKEVDRIIARMIAEGRRYDPTELLEHGQLGCRSLLHGVFSEAFATTRLSREDAWELILELGADSFDRREQATRDLHKAGRVHADLVKEAAESDDPEIRFRAAYIVRLWRREADQAHVPNSKLAQALGAYTERLDGEAARRALAKCVVAALMARVDKTLKQECLAACTRALAKSREDSVHNILLPLVEHQDPAVPMFAMRHIAGRTGNSYVAPIHLHALDSGCPELIKAALRSMPCPIWDGRAKPKVREVLRDLFTGAESVRELRADTDFMMLSAFVAARDFRVPEAKDYLLKKIRSDDKNIALRAIQALGDTYYRGTPVYPQLLAALGPHFTADEPKFRHAAVETLRFYRGPEVVGTLLTALGDPDEKVFKEAGQAIVDYHQWNGKKASPIVDRLRDEKKRIQDKRTRNRIDHVLEFLASDPKSYILEW